MNGNPIIELEVPREIRVNRLVMEYGKADPKEFLEAMIKITKKLGGQHFKAAKKNFYKATGTQPSTSCSPTTTKHTSTASPAKPTESNQKFPGTETTFNHS